jgi:predicted CXXCH cytochrome family protein
VAVAWDTQHKRWFHLYPHEAIPSTDELHWTRPLQNWNYMCADCHSTNLQKNYDLTTNRYHTTFSEINVSCETCHGPGSIHVALAQSHKVFWDRRYGYGLPHLKDSNPRVQIESCAPCHARRRLVYPDYRPGEKFLDHYMPELLDSEAYYPDGQIRDEDYEYGSFIQSRMYHEQVRCSNCHDPHTMHVKFKEGPTIKDNRLCAQCHLPTQFDTPAHHHHPDASKPGTLCIQCHMPTTDYMVVDPRLDHSIRIPRPDLTVSLGIPNACNKCHHDTSKGETPQWAQAKVQQWYGEHRGPEHFTYAIAAGRQGKPEGREKLQTLLRRKDLNAMVRASALILLSGYGADAVQWAAVDALEDPEELVRVAAVRSLQDQARQDLARWLIPKLRDPVRAVRIEAARILSVLPPSAFDPQQQSAFDAALAEFITAQHALAEQTAAHVTLGIIDLNRQHALQEDATRQMETGADRAAVAPLVEAARSFAKHAEEEDQTALRIDSTCIPARVNLAMLLNEQGRNDEAEKQFRTVIRLNPKIAEVYYSLGLLLAEDEKRLDEAAKVLGRATDLAPKNARIHYNRGLALQKLGRAAEAERELRLALDLAPRSPDFLNALAILCVQQHRWPEAAAYAQQLVRVSPEQPQFQQLLAQIRRWEREAEKGSQEERATRGK